MPELSPSSSPAKSISSVLATLRILEEVAQRQPIGVSELARATEMPKSTVQRCLVTLREAGWLHMVDTSHSKWGVTTKPLGIGLRAAGEEGLREVAEPYLEELREATNETIHLAVREGNALIIVARRDSMRAVRTFVQLGTRAPLHATASGLAILAKLSADEVNAVVSHGLESYTPSTFVDRAMLLSEVDRTRERGFAVNATAWWRPEVSAIGAPIMNRAGRPVAAIAISIPASRFEPSQVPELGALAVRVTGKISAELGRY